MTITKLLSKVNAEKPNSFTNEMLVDFVNEVESEVAEELRVRQVTYTTSAMNKELMVPAPYDRLYISYMKARIDQANEELDSYANNIAQHNTDYQEFVNWVVRERKANDRNRITRFRNMF